MMMTRLRHDAYLQAGGVTSARIHDYVLEFEYKKDERGEHIGIFSDKATH